MLPGGDLMIRYTEAAVLMAGDAETVFEGTVEI
jgi:diaminopimelate epimerase